MVDEEKRNRPRRQTLSTENVMPVNEKRFRTVLWELSEKLDSVAAELDDLISHGHRHSVGNSIRNNDRAMVLNGIMDVNQDQINRMRHQNKTVYEPDNMRLVLTTSDTAATWMADFYRVAKAAIPTNDALGQQYLSVIENAYQQYNLPLPTRDEMSHQAAHDLRQIENFFDRGQNGPNVSL